MEQGPYKAVGEALEVIPRTLAQNCGANVIRTLTKLRAKHADPANATFGIDGNTGRSPGASSSDGNHPLSEGTETRGM